MTIPVIFGVDVEPDPRLVNQGSPEPLVGYELTQRYLRDLRPRIEAVTGAPVHYSWFLRIDAQMEPYGSATWIPDRYGAHMEEIQRAGDEIGVHPHAYRWLQNERSWLHDFANQSWVDHSRGSITASRWRSRASRRRWGDPVCLCGSATDG